MTTSELSTMLSDIGKNREWLAEELGISKRTIDSWCTAKGEFPTWASKLIPILCMQEAMLSPQFSPAQISVIHQAMDAQGYTDVIEYMTDSVIKMSEEDTKKKVKRRSG